MYSLPSNFHFLVIKNTKLYHVKEGGEGERRGRGGGEGEVSGRRAGRERHLQLNDEY